MLTIQKSSMIENLFDGCLRKNPKSQKDLYSRMSPKMLGICRRYIGDHNEAEHVMIGGFVKVFKNVGQVNLAGNFEGWIRRIMVNECLTYLRKNKAIFMQLEIDEGDLVDYKIENHDCFMMENILNALDKLNIGYRTVFNLYVVEGYSHKEISSRLGISMNTSKSQLSRARKLLQKSLIENNNTGYKNKIL